MRLLFAGYLTLSTVKKYALQSWGRFAQLPWLPVACPQLIYQQTHPVPFFVRNLFFFALTFPLLSVACFPRGFLVVCLFVLFFRCRSGTLVIGDSSCSENSLEKSLEPVSEISYSSSSFASVKTSCHHLQSCIPQQKLFHLIEWPLLCCVK